MTVPSAPASRYVPSEAGTHGLGQTAHRDTVSISPRDEVLRRSEMSASRDLRVAGVHERVSEPVQRRSRRTRS
jgi:hypothetical protein